MLTMDIEFTAHALERMRKYGVDKAMVEKTLLAPDSGTKAIPSVGYIKRGSTAMFSEL